METLPTVVEGLVLPPGGQRGGDLTQAQYEAMKRATRITRDTLILMTFRNTGLRPGEMAALEVRDVAQEGSTYYIRVRRLKKRTKKKPKGKPTILGPTGEPLPPSHPVAQPFEVMALNPSLGQWLTDWLKSERREPGKLLWGLTSRSLHGIVRQAGIDALGYPVNPRMFRRLHADTTNQIATALYGRSLEGAVMASIQLGHDDVRTTLRHYLNTPDKRRQVQERIPV